MARTFEAASSQYLEYAGAPVTAVPLTLACWFQSTNITTSYALMALGVGAATSRVQIVAAGANAGDPIVASTVPASDTSAGASTSTAYTANTWHHAAGIFTSATSRRALLDGGGGVTNTGSKVLTTPDTTTLGARISSGARGTFHDGLIAEAGIWNVALTDAEVAVLAAGFSPLLVRPSALVAYWPLIGRNAPELDLRGNAPLTNTGTTVGDHVRIYYPAVRRFVAVPTVGGDTALIGASALSVAASAVLATAILFSSAASATVTASSALTTAIPLVAASTLTVTASGAMDAAAAALVGASTATVTATAALTTAIRFTAVSACAVTASSTLTTAIPLAAVAACAVTASSALTTAIPLASVAQASVTATSVLSTSIALASAATASVTATGTLESVVVSTPSRIMLSGSYHPTITLTGSVG